MKPAGPAYRRASWETFGSRECSGALETPTATGDRAGELVEPKAERSGGARKLTSGVLSGKRGVCEFQGVVFQGELKFAVSKRQGRRFRQLLRRKRGEEIRSLRRTFLAENSSPRFGRTIFRAAWSLMRLRCGALGGGREGGETKARQSPRRGNGFLESEDSKGHPLWRGFGPA